MQRNLGRFNASLAEAPEDFSCEMQSRSRRCHRATLAGIDRLIALAIGRAVEAVNIRRQRHVTDALDSSKKISQRREPNPSLSETAALQSTPTDDFCLQLCPVPEKQPLANSNL